MTYPEIFKPRRIVPALTIAALLGAGSVTALTQSAGPALANAPVAGGYVDLVARVSPAVVTIETRSSAAAEMNQKGQFDAPNPFENFSRRFGMPMPDMPGNGGVVQGAGTGFIITADGRIVTNAHVVDGADEVEVTLSDGRKLPAEVIGIDRATDIAVLQIKADDLPYVEFGESDDLKVGENVIAIGNPFGLGTTVTTGIVSAIGRDLNSGPFDNFIQTDAAINRGNSGGPLFNDAGEVVGMNTAILSPSGGSVGIGFAVPGDMVKAVVADIADDGQVERGWLGVRIQPVSDEVATVLGLDAARGAMIEAVEPDTPAEGAGLMKGDIVVSVNGATVDGPRDLTRLIAGDKPGAAIRLGVLRKGDTLEIGVTLGERAVDEPA